MHTDIQFAHERLDAVLVAERYLEVIAEILPEIPRGNRKVADELQRSSDSVYQNLCEGAGRFKPLQKAHCYDIALASGTESAGSLNIVRIRRLADLDRVVEARELLLRVVQMVTRMAANARERAG